MQSHHPEVHNTIRAMVQQMEGGGQKNLELRRAINYELAAGARKRKISQTLPSSMSGSSGTRGRRVIVRPDGSLAVEDSEPTALALPSEGLGHGSAVGKVYRVKGVSFDANNKIQVAQLMLHSGMFGIANIPEVGSIRRRTRSADTAEPVIFGRRNIIARGYDVSKGNVIEAMKKHGVSEHLVRYFRAQKQKQDQNRSKSSRKSYRIYPKNITEEWVADEIIRNYGYLLDYTGGGPSKLTPRDVQRIGEYFRKALEMQTKNIAVQPSSYTRTHALTSATATPSNSFPERAERYSRHMHMQEQLRRNSAATQSEAELLTTAPRRKKARQTVNMNVLDPSLYKERVPGFARALARGVPDTVDLGKSTALQVGKSAVSLGKAAYNSPTVRAVAKTGVHSIVWNKAPQLASKCAIL